jgi:hypothetical protein
MGGKTLKKNGESITMNAPAMIVNDRAMIPLRAVSQALGFDVEWVNSVGSIIYYK